MDMTPVSPNSTTFYCRSCDQFSSLLEALYLLARTKLGSRPGCMMIRQDREFEDDPFAFKVTCPSSMIKFNMAKADLFDRLK